MTYLTAMILGLVQGVAEFLPISSSGHLSLLQHFMGLANMEDQIFFDVLLHFGTLLALFVVYFRDIIAIVRDFWDFLCGCFSKEPAQTAEKPSENSRMGLLLLVATLPLFLILPFQSVLEGLYGNTLFIGFALLVTGTLLFFSDRMARGQKTAYTGSLRDVLLVGCGQALAVVPGLSRSGTTIATGMLCGFERNFAVRFSFLLSIPAVLGANLLNLVDAMQGGITLGLLPIYLVGMAVAAVSGYFAIRWVKRLTEDGKFGRFSYYCWSIGLVAIVATLVTQ